jgi:DNA modification methylase
MRCSGDDAAVQIKAIYHGDNLPALKEHFPDESIDLVYLDPPFNSNRAYTALQGNENSAVKARRGAVFDDVWRWDDEAQRTYEKLRVTSYELRVKTGVPHSSLATRHSSLLPDILPGLKQITGETGLMAYLLMLAPRLVELRRVLKLTGSIYLHCDQHASAYIRILMDAVFGRENFLNCIVWCYGLGGSSRRYWPRKHDDILWYSKEPDAHYFDPVMIPATSQKLKGQLKKAPDFWQIPTINNQAKERVGYPTQKPEALLERIIGSSSRPGEVVLDPFCGSGTTLVAAQRLGRRWVGIDSSDEAIDIARERLGMSVKVIHSG